MNNKIGTLRYSLITTFLVYLILLPGTCVDATELTTSPSGIDVWRDGIYIGKTPLQIEGDPESTFYLFTFATTDGISPYRILRLDPTAIQSENIPYDLYPLIAPNLFYEKYGLGMMSMSIGHGTFPYIFLNNDVGQSYGNYTKPPIYKFEIFTPFTNDKYIYPNSSEISPSYLSPDSRYIAFFESKGSHVNSLRELYLYEVLGINPETKFPIFQRIETQHPIGVYSVFGEFTYFSPDSRWLSFCLQDEDSDCQFFIIDLQHPAEEFIPVGKDQKFDECLWQKNGSQIACKWKDHFNIYAAKLGNDDRTNIFLLRDFSITGITDDKAFKDDFFYFAGDFIIWRLRGSTEKIIVYNVLSEKTEITFTDSFLDLISEDGRYIGIRTKLSTVADQVELPRELKEKLLEEENEPYGEYRLCVYQLFDTTKQTTLSNVFYDEKNFNFLCNLNRKSNFFQTETRNFAAYLSKLNEHVIYPEILMSFIPKESLDKFHHPEENTAIQIMNDFVIFKQFWKFDAFDKKTQEDIVTMFAYYQYPLPGDNDIILIHTLFKFPESGSFE